jgi:hypothetical protein
LGEDADPPTRDVVERPDLNFGFVESFEYLAAAVVIELSSFGCHD